MNKEEIKKLIDKEIKDKENKQTFYSLFFIAFTIFFASLIQLLIYYYSNSDFVISLMTKIIIIGVTALSMLVVYTLLADILDRLKIKKSKIHTFLLVALALIIYLIIAFIIFGAPKSQLIYGFTCPEVLDYGSNISLFVENSGEIISSYQFYSKATSKLAFVYSKEVNESSSEKFRIFPKNTYTLNYQVYFDTNKNVTNITINNFFDCFPKSKIDCILTSIVSHEDKCVYVKYGSRYKKETKPIFVKLD